MTLRTKALLSATAMFCLSAPAFAQDGHAGGGDVSSWTGPYIGGSLGYGWQPNSKRDRNESLAFDTNGDGVFDNQVTTAAGGNAFAPGFCRGQAFGSSPAGCSGDKDGKAVWSLHAGYDYQIGTFVLGGVVEAGKSNFSNSVSGFSTTPASYTFTRKLDWDGAARLRGGVALNSGTLIYGTGGLAYGKIKRSFETTNGFNTFTENDSSKNDWGWTAGAGVEQKVSSNFSIGVLYKYTRFNDSGYVVNAGQGTPPSATNPFVNPTTTVGSTDIIRTSSRFDNQSVRATASFRF